MSVGDLSPPERTSGKTNNTGADTGLPPRDAALSGPEGDLSKGAGHRPGTRTKEGPGQKKPRRAQSEKPCPLWVPLRVAPSCVVPKCHISARTKAARQPRSVRCLRRVVAAELARAGEAIPTPCETRPASFTQKSHHKWTHAAPPTFRRYRRRQRVLQCFTTCSMRSHVVRPRRTGLPLCGGSR